MTQAAARSAQLRQPITPVLEVPADDHIVRNILLFFALHIPLALLMDASSLMTTLHAFLTLLVGANFLLRDKDSTRVLYLVAYIVGAELLWRGNGALLFWEAGKYSIILFLLISMLKERNFARYDILPVFYFLLLLPAIFRSLDWGSFSPEVASRLTFFDMIPYRLGFDREQLAFHLAGPLALTVAASYFASKKLTLPQLRNVFVSFLGPAIGLLALAILGTVQAGSDVLSTLYTSSRVTSAGIGPNQVSSLLGLAATVAFFLIFVLEDRGFLKIIAGVLAAMMLTQALLTFSRGGVLNAIGAMFIGSVVLLRERRARAILLASGLSLVLLTTYVIFPYLNQITNGGLSVRFNNEDDSGRSEILENQFEAFLDSPVFGHGIGQITLRQHTSHNEYTRTAGEHGIVGILGFLIIIFVTFKKLLSDLSPLQLAFSATFIAWTFLYFSYTGTRLAAPSLMFGLAMATLIIDSPGEEADQPALQPIKTYGQRKWQSETTR